MAKIKRVIEFFFPNFTCLACGTELNNEKVQNICDKCFSQFKYALPNKINADTHL